MKKVIVYFGQKKLVSSALEAVGFINTLKYRGSGYLLVCNKHTEELLKDLFSNPSHPYHSNNVIEIATTGCSTTRILMYEALADSLKQHDAIVEKREEERKCNEEKRRKKAEQLWLSEMYTELKGWYVVTITGVAMKLKGNDGESTASVRVLADSQMDAYHKAVKHLESNPKGNILNWMHFESAKSAMIEFVGIWTDESELEFN